MSPNEKDVHRCLNLCTMQYEPQHFDNHHSEEKAQIFSRIFYTVLKRITVFSNLLQSSVNPHPANVENMVSS